MQHDNALSQEEERIPGFELKVDEFEAYLKDGGSILIIKRGKYIYEAFLHSQIVLSAFDGSPLAALAILKKKICDHPLLSTKRAAEDVLEGMESTLTPEEAGVAERLAMHIAQENLIPVKAPCSNLFPDTQDAKSHSAPDRLKTVEQQSKKIFTESRCTREACLKTVTEHKEQIRYFSQQDLRELFSLPKGGFDVSPTQQQLYEEHYNQIKLDEFLESHVKFLETLGISGVSHHSLLFSKTAPIQQNEVEEIMRRRGTTSYLGGPSASSSQDNMNNGAEYAFKPKDVKLDKRIINISPIDENDLSEREIKARVSRLSMLFQNKSMVASLPDRGAKIQKQIAELTRELEEIKAAQSSDMSHQVIDISQKMHIILQS
ncbi:hypothetical protein HID58_049450 [Brassica napus]|uniref:Uncharacterized protein n=1 Tax=Brassica napus TaxID=3708 RepID=A0ABQ8B517_BRANA|nr:hypothetical protein HID58_049450 [Brassica napus]